MIPIKETLISSCMSYFRSIYVLIGLIVIPVFHRKFIFDGVGNGAPEPKGGNDILTSHGRDGDESS